MLPTPPGSSLCGHTVSSGLSAVSLLACGVSVCCLLLSLSLLSPYVTCLSSDLWEAEFYTTCIIRGPLCQITGFSSLEYTSNTGKIPTDHDFSADRSIVGVSWKTNRLLYICLDPVCQLINPFPSPPFANNAVVWTHHTRSSKPSHIWCIRRIWPD